jgi:hypothetical protein
MRRSIRYVLRVRDPRDKRWKTSLITKTLRGMGRRMAANLAFNKDYYCDDAGKRLKLRLTCEEKRGGSGRCWRSTG